MKRTSSEFSIVFRQKRYALQNETPPILNCMLWNAFSEVGDPTFSWLSTLTWLKRCCEFRSSRRNPIRSAISKNVWIYGIPKAHLAVVVVGQLHQILAQLHQNVIAGRRLLDGDVCPLGHFLTNDPQSDSP